MAVHIRLRRMGAKKRPFYRIVAADSRRARDGRFLENVGTYNPITQPAEVTVVEDKLTKWLDQGAIPSDTVKTLLSQIGFIEKYEKVKKGEDVSEVVLKKHITERKKKTRKAKKATVTVEATAAGETPAEAPAEKAEETKTEEVTAEEEKSE
ncbi:MAG: 30S ribosomal protein S16 [candidate division Zixibacteria bacterium]|nr:30S ribosomal protein S16 [candidate division Zixibacteria bacterium]